MSIVQAPTKAELEALAEDIQNRRVALLDKYGLFGGGEIVNMKFDVLNKSYDKIQAQLDKLSQNKH